MGNLPVWISGSNEYFSETNSANLLEELHFALGLKHGSFLQLSLKEREYLTFLPSLSLLKDIRGYGKK